MILSLHFLPNLFFFSSSHEYLDFSGFAQILWIFDGWQGWFYCWKHKKTKYYCFTFLGCLSSKRSKCQLFFVCFHYFIFELGLSFFSTNLLSLCQIFNKKKVGNRIFRFPLFYTVPHLGSFKDEWTMMMWIMFWCWPILCSHEVGSLYPRRQSIRISEYPVCSWFLLFHWGLWRQWLRWLT